MDVNEIEVFVKIQKKFFGSSTILGTQRQYGR